MKFFNKSRRQAMSKSKVAKYLRYAVGEIVLVVIGILIAVAINNLQSNKADILELNRILKLVSLDLKNDVKEIDTVLKDFKYSQELMLGILSNDEKSTEFISSCTECKYLLSEYSTALINQNGINLLKSYNNVPDESRTLISDINAFYDNNIPNIDLSNQLMKDEVINFVTYLRNNKTWFKAYFTDNECNSDCKLYFSSQDYINRISFIEPILSYALIAGFEDYSENAKKLIKRIEAY